MGKENIMACGGCRRNRTSSGTRAKPKPKPKPKPKKKTTSTVMFKSALSSKDLATRKKKCSRCPFNTSSGLSGRCKKGNRMIVKLISDQGYKCPIKRF